MEKLSLLVALDLKPISGLPQDMLTLIQHLLKSPLWKLKRDLHSVMMVERAMCHVILTTLKFMFILENIYWMQ